MELTIQFDIHFGGYDHDVKQRGITRTFETFEDTPLPKIMNDILNHRASEWLEEWCNKNNVDYYNDQGYSIENIMLAVVRMKGDF